MYFPPQDNIFQIEVTTQCNLKCEGCSRTVGINANQWLSKHMPLETFRTAIQNTRPSQAIILQGIGEPTLHPHLPEMISIAKESGKFHTIAFYTNALARSIEYYDDLKLRGLNLVTVSVDSLDQTVVDLCRAGTDIKKLTQRLCELYYTFAPNMNISLVLSRKNLEDCFQTLKLLNMIAAAGNSYITIFIQKMIATSDDIARDFVLSTADTEKFRAKMDEVKAQYPNLRLGLCGDLNIDMPDSVITDVPHVQPIMNAPVLCEKPYMDRFVTLDGFLSPCCVLTDKNEWNQTPLDNKIEDILTTNSNITEWFKNYQQHSHPGCKNCSLFSPLKNTEKVLLS